MQSKPKIIRGELTLYSHFFTVTNFDGFVRHVLRQYVQDALTSFKMVPRRGRWLKEPDKRFYWPSGDGNTIRFHINCLEDFYGRLQAAGITKEMLVVKKAEFARYDPAYADIEINPEFTLYPYQEDIRDEVINVGARKIIALPTGKGKTVTVLSCAAELKFVTGVFMLPKYLEKWVGDLKKYVKNIQRSDYVILNSVDKLRRVITDMQKGKTRAYRKVKFYVITLTTVAAYIKLYTNNQSKEKLIPLEEVWYILKMGFRFTDEGHEHFHKNFILDLFTHMPKTAYLSATLEPSVPFMNQMYNIMYPVHQRLGEDQYVPYINVTAFHYRHYNPDKFKHTLQDKYNHGEYESNYLAGEAHLREVYFEMIYRIMEDKYFSIRRPKQKAIIFFYLVEMCTLFVEFLKKKRPDLDARRYISQDPFENALDAEVVVSTHGSAGTAIDIPGLILNILTISIKSRQANLQNMGRLRVVADHPDMNPNFVYLVADDIDGSARYHEERKSMFSKRALSLKDEDHATVIRLANNNLR